MKNNKRGFTLVELVVAIATLALCSGIILSMYITSENTAYDANLYDDSVIWCSNIAEIFKQSTDIESFIDNANLTENYLSNEGSQIKWVYYLNEDWYQTDIENDIAIKIELFISEDTEYISGKLYKLKINISKVSNESTSSIMELVTKKYLAGGES